jgi:hypothetical protein
LVDLISIADGSIDYTAPTGHRLSRASRALYAFAHYPDLWKALVLHELGQRHAALPAAQR